MFSSLHHLLCSMVLFPLGAGLAKYAKEMPSMSSQKIQLPVLNSCDLNKIFQEKLLFFFWKCSTNTFRMSYVWNIIKHSEGAWEGGGKKLNYELQQQEQQEQGKIKSLRRTAALLVLAHCCLAFSKCLGLLVLSNIVKTTDRHPIFSSQHSSHPQPKYEILNTLNFCLFWRKGQFSSSICHI